MITAQELRSILRYDHETGAFSWKARPRVRAGKTAGWSDDLGYIHIRTGGVLYLAHRLAWLYVYGAWPEKNLDHANGVPGDNRISNLREADQHQNTANSKLSKANTSGFKGVARKRNKWRAYITVNRKQIGLGVYESEEEAAQARATAAAQFHGKFARAA